MSEREYFVGTQSFPEEDGLYRTEQNAKEAIQEHSFKHEETLYITNTDDAH